MLDPKTKFVSYILRQRAGDCTCINKGTPDNGAYVVRWQIAPCCELGINQVRQCDIDTDFAHFGYRSVHELTSKLEL